MSRIDTVVIGAGQAGLAMSRSLAERGIEHVVLERGAVAERWRSERWDSLRLLTPNWQTRLPGFAYRGTDPDGYMSRDDVIAHLDAYARTIAAPIETGVRVTSVERRDGAYRVGTDRGTWDAENVVIATGHCDRPFVPAFASELTGDVRQVVPSAYRRPADLPPGGVLVVGASATGLQLAEEIRLSGRAVTLAVGRHNRVPRTYRGRDIQHWLDAIGLWDETVDDVRNIARSRRDPSLQLIGSPDRRTLDLGVLQAEGVRLVGHAIGAERHRIALARDLGETMAAADARMRKLLRRIDEHIVRSGHSADAPESLRPIVPVEAPSSLDLRKGGIESVLWATGYRRSYAWLGLPVLDARGEIRHRGGITAQPGLYVLGLQFLRTRKSSFLDGVGADAEYLADHILCRRSADCSRAA